MNSNHFEYLKENKELFLGYFIEKYPVYYQANVFLRDIQFCIESFLNKRDKKVSFKQVEFTTELFIAYLEKEGILKGLHKNVWLFNYKIEAPVEEAEVSPETAIITE